MQEARLYNCEMFISDDFKTVYMLIKLHQTFFLSQNLLVLTWKSQLPVVFQ